MLPASVSTTTPPRHEIVEMRSSWEPSELDKLSKVSANSEREEQRRLDSSSEEEMGAAVLGLYEERRKRIASSV
jgi:hypothetical protein